MKKLLLFLCLLFPVLSLGQADTDVHTVRKAVKNLDGVIIKWQAFRTKCTDKLCNEQMANKSSNYDKDIYVVVVNTKEGIFEVHQSLRPVRQGMFSANSGEGEKATLHQFSDGSMVVLEK